MSIARAFHVGGGLCVTREFDDRFEIETIQPDHADWAEASMLAERDGAAPAPQEPSGASLARLRQGRDRLLAQSDWTQLPDASLSDAERTAWRAYRQALRDLPQVHDDDTDVIWPARPAKGE